MSNEKMVETTKFITITETGGRLNVHLRGEFGYPEECALELAQLNELSDDYDFVTVYIDSPGGTLNLLTELIEIFGKFNNVITIACGQIKSAGFLLWCIGDIRVTQPYVEIMAHREAYGISGKTDTHMAYAEYSNKMGLLLVGNVCGDVLTPEEFETIKHSEVYFMPQELIDRGVCISWKQYQERETLMIETSTVFIIDEKMYMEMGGGNIIEIEDIQTKETYSYLDVVYCGSADKVEEEEVIPEPEKPAPKKRKSRAKKKPTTELLEE
ncbi:MAG: ATP-dependent Clp protease proteolytic subunit [Thiomicrorhabdus sp.]|nr:ATP-dependent Clp protease proteolytic subunit [Thiomicrorhabdus sp.]